MINYLYHLLHLILKKPALCLDACSQTTSPLLHCEFNNSVIKCRPLLDQSLSQMLNITYACLVHPFLHQTPDFVINWIEVRTVGWLLQHHACYRYWFPSLATALRTPCVRKTLSESSFLKIYWPKFVGMCQIGRPSGAPNGEWISTSVLKLFTLLQGAVFFRHGVGLHTSTTCTKIQGLGTHICM